MDIKNKSTQKHFKSDHLNIKSLLNNKKLDSLRGDIGT